MFTLKLSEGGRIVVPAEVRKALEITEGSTLLGELRNGELVLTTRKARLERARKLFQQYFPPQADRSLVDELITERRAEAAQEDQ